MKALETDAGTSLDRALARVGLALIDRNFTICAELIIPCSKNPTNIKIVNDLTLQGTTPQPQSQYTTNQYQHLQKCTAWKIKTTQRIVTHSVSVKTLQQRFDNIKKPISHKCLYNLTGSTQPRSIQFHTCRKDYKPEPLPFHPLIDSRDLIFKTGIDVPTCQNFSCNVAATHQLNTIPNFCGKVTDSFVPFLQNCFHNLPIKNLCTKPRIAVSERPPNTSG